MGDKTVSQQDKNRAIHEAMGLCWHEPERVKANLAMTSSAFPISPMVFYRRCRKCGEANNLANPDYFTPVGFFKVKEWLIEKDEPLPNFNAMTAMLAEPIAEADYHEDNPDSLPNKLWEMLKENEDGLTK